MAKRDELQKTCKTCFVAEYLASVTLAEKEMNVSCN